MSLLKTTTIPILPSIVASIRRLVHRCINPKAAIEARNDKVRRQNTPTTTRGLPITAPTPAPSTPTPTTPTPRTPSTSPTCYLLRNDKTTNKNYISDFVIVRCQRAFEWFTLIAVAGSCLYLFYLHGITPQASTPTSASAQRKGDKRQFFTS